MNSGITTTIDELPPRFASQFLLTATADCLLVECSAGTGPDASGSRTLPLHTRLALPWQGAHRLAMVLSQALAQYEQHLAGSQSALPLQATNCDVNDFPSVVKVARSTVEPPPPPSHLPVPGVSQLPRLQF